MQNVWVYVLEAILEQYDTHSGIASEPLGAH